MLATSGELISGDGWTWHSGAERPGGSAAPDVMKTGDRYICLYSAADSTPTLAAYDFSSDNAKWRLRSH